MHPALRTHEWGMASVARASPQLFFEREILGAKEICLRIVSRGSAFATQSCGQASWVDLLHVHASPVIHALEGEEIVYGSYRFRIAAGYHHLATARQIGRSVGDFRAKRPHRTGARNVWHGVNYPGQREVAVRKRRCDRAHMSADRCGPRGVVLFSLQHDATAIREGFEDVLRSVLIHAHHGFAALLKIGKSGVRAALRVAALTRDESRHRAESRPRQPHGSPEAPTGSIP